MIDTEKKYGVRKIINIHSYNASNKETRNNKTTDEEKKKLVQSV